MEFKPANEDGLFTYNQADAMMKNGWEMLDGEEWDYIRDNYECKYMDGGVMIDGRIFLPQGQYWVPEFMGPDDSWETIYTYDDEKPLERGWAKATERCCVRLVRYVR